MVKHQKVSKYYAIDCRKLQDYETTSMGEILFRQLKKYLAEVSSHLHLQLCENILEWLLSFQVTSCKKE